VVTNVIALVIGLITAQVIQPGKNVGEIGDVEAQEAAEGQGLMEWFISIIPTNPFEAFSTGNILQVIITAILLVVAIRLVGEKADPFVHVVESFHEIIQKVTYLVLIISPIGVFALMTSVIATQGFEIVQKLIMYIIGLILAILVMLAVYTAILALLKI